MTYCIGIRLKKGLVFMSDTRTNAGVTLFSLPNTDNTKY